MKNACGYLLFLSILFSGSATANVATEVEAGKLLDSMNWQAIADQSIDTVLDEHIKREPGLAPLRNVIRAFFAKYMSYEARRADLITIYASEFTELELREIRAFYSTPTGRKAISRMPALMAKGSEMAAKKIQEHAPELRKLLEAESMRIQKLREADASAAKPSESIPPAR